MEAKKEAKLNMFHTVIALCEDNLATVALIVAFQTGYNAFKTTVAAIVTAAAQLEAQTGGYAISKMKAKKDLAEFGAGIAGMLYAFASTKNDDVLKEAMHISYSDISHAKDDDVVAICSTIYDTANSHLADLADYGITAAVLTSFNGGINDYSGKAPKPREAVNLKKGVRNTLNTLFNDASKIAKEQLDKIAVEYLHNGNKEFYNSYESARIIIDPGTFKTVAQLQVLNTANNEPLINVKCYRDTSVSAKKSSTKGFITYRDLAEGSHSFMLKKEGFKDTKAQAVVAHGKKITLVVMMDIV